MGGRSRPGNAQNLAISRCPGRRLASPSGCRQGLQARVLGQALALLDLRSGSDSRSPANSQNPRSKDNSLLYPSRSSACLLQDALEWYAGDDRGPSCPWPRFQAHPQLSIGDAVTPGQTPASTPHATPAFGLSPARESASPPPSQQQFNPFQPLVPYATAAQMAAPPPPPPQA